ncbi:hypothetical protein Tco_0357262 [Tanacetum coccineum]
MYHDLCLCEKALAERKNVGFDLTKSDLCPSFIKDLTAKGVGLRVADSHTGNHRKDDFTPLETILRLNPFGYAKLTTFVVMCKAYGYEPSVELFRGFFNLFPGGMWLTFAKRPEKHIPNLLPKFITRIEGWKGRLFFVQDSVILADCPGLLSKDNRWDTKSFRDKLPDMIHENLSFQRHGRYPTNVRVSPDPILFLVGLKTSWEHSQQRPMYAETDEDLSFLPKEPSLDFGTGSPSVSINTKPPVTVAEPTEQLVENTTDSRDSPRREKLVIHSGSVAGRIKDRKSRTRGGSSKPLVKHRLVQDDSSSRATRQKTASLKDDSPILTISDINEGLSDVLELQDSNACHLKISNITPLACKSHLDNQLDVKLLDLHDRCYVRRAVVDNVVNRRARELLKVVEQIKEECDVLKERGKVRDKEREELKAKCEAAMADFDNNPAVKVLRKKIVALLVEVSLSTLESKVASLEAKKTKLEIAEASLRQKVENLVVKLVSSAIFFGRCHAFEEVANMKELFDLTKVKGYRSSYKQEHTKVGNEFATTIFPFLFDVVADPHASVKALLSKKPRVLQRPAPLRTYVPASSAPSQKATLSLALVSKPLSPPPQVTPVATLVSKS